MGVNSFTGRVGRWAFVLGAGAAISLWGSAVASADDSATGSPAAATKHVGSASPHVGRPTAMAHKAVPARGLANTPTVTPAPSDLPTLPDISDLQAVAAAATGRPKVVGTGTSSRAPSPAVGYSQATNLRGPVGFNGAMIAYSDTPAVSTSTALGIGYLTNSYYSTAGKTILFSNGINVGAIPTVAGPQTVLAVYSLQQWTTNGWVTQASTGWMPSTVQAGGSPHNFLGWYGYNSSPVHGYWRVQYTVAWFNSSNQLLGWGILVPTSTGDNTCGFGNSRPCYNVGANGVYL